MIATTLATIGEESLSIGGYTFDTVCNSVFLIGAAWMIGTVVVQDVRELKDGDMIQEV